MAYIYLKTDNFVFRVNGGFTLNSIAFVGIDMHVQGVPLYPPCPLMPNPILCTCMFNNADSQLYNSSSICSIKKIYIQNTGNMFLGFFELSII